MADGYGTAFVLGGGGVLGAAEVGMLRALFERGITPDAVVGSSIGALNGAFVAAAPVAATVERMASVWRDLGDNPVLGGGLVGRLGTLARQGTHLHDNSGLRALLDAELAGLRIEDLAVHYECVAASIERASARWFDRGPLTEAVLASCAVPGLLPPVEIDGEHYLDGGLVASVPVGRALAIGARRVYVLHVGRVDQPLRPPRRPWEVGLVTFEIVRRHRFSEDLASVPEGAEVTVLPTGLGAPGLRLRYRRASDVSARIEAAYEASSRALDEGRS